MLAPFALSVLLLVAPQLGLEQIRRALEVAVGPAAERKAFLEKYLVRFPASEAEHVAAIELLSPFREVIERAAAQIRLGNSYTEYQAMQEAQQSGPALRILVRVALPPNRLPLHTALPLGSDFRIVLSYQPRKTASARVITERAFTVTQTCQGIPCFLQDPAVDGALLQTSLPLVEESQAPSALGGTEAEAAQGAGQRQHPGWRLLPRLLPASAAALVLAVDPEGPLTVTVAAPSGQSRSARFDLAKLR